MQVYDTWSALQFIINNLAVLRIVLSCYLSGMAVDQMVYLQLTALEASGKHVKLLPVCLTQNHALH